MLPVPIHIDEGYSNSSPASSFRSIQLSFIANLVLPLRQERTDLDCQAVLFPQSLRHSYQFSRRHLPALHLELHLYVH